MNPARKGTKSAFHSRITVAPGQSAIAAAAPERRGRRSDLADPFGDFDQTFVERKGEADEFYRNLIPTVAQRGRHQRRPPGLRRAAVDQAGLRLRRREVAERARHKARLGPADAATSTGSTFTARTSSRCRTSGSIRGSPPGTWRSTRSSLGFIDPEFANDQLGLMLRDRYQHPNGSLPAYEWNFDDVNPPVHAWAALFNYPPEPRQPGRRGAAVPQAHVPHAGLELHLVDQPQGPRRPQPVRGRLPGPRQHRRLRPQRATADRRLSGTGRRDVVDGFLRPVHARHGAGAGASSTRRTRSWRSSSTSTSSRSRRRSTRTTPRTRCGTRRTASSTTCCAFPVSSRRASRCDRSSACSRCARSRSIRPRWCRSCRTSWPR